MSKSVLIVDDERLLARTLSKALKEAGYKTTTASTAEQAEKHIFSGQKFDLVVLDNRLPRSSGLEILEHMRQQDIRSRVILMTAFESAEVKSGARRLQVDKYVRKPFDLPGMLREVEDLVGAPDEDS